eukprot:TRINITY_DN10773_c0_g2_i2.p1 TRINITY_DN10773_c0_g2~~TRINITY_DN10773_c0_g2_i2.p1  ORF type:complete len:1052 (-),score=153.95 TRINITY_DN10773_c0_g2_i2:687-3842(-)
MWNSSLRAAGKAKARPKQAAKTVADKQPDAGGAKSSPPNSARGALQSRAATAVAGAASSRTQRSTGLAVANATTRGRTSPTVSEQQRPSSTEPPRRLRRPIASGHAAASGKAAAAKMRPDRQSSPQQLGRRTDSPQPGRPSPEHHTEAEASPQPARLDLHDATAASEGHSNGYASRGSQACAAAAAALTGLDDRSSYGADECPEPLAEPATDFVEDVGTLENPMPESSHSRRGSQADVNDRRLSVCSELQSTTQLESLPSSASGLQLGEEIDKVDETDEFRNATPVSAHHADTDQQLDKLLEQFNQLMEVARVSGAGEHWPVGHAPTKRTSTVMQPRKTVRLRDRVSETEFTVPGSPNKEERLAAQKEAGGPFDNVRRLASTVILDKMKAMCSNGDGESSSSESDSPDDNSMPSRKASSFYSTRSERIELGFQEGQAAQLLQDEEQFRAESAELQRLMDVAERREWEKEQLSEQLQKQNVELDELRRAALELQLQNAPLSQSQVTQESSLSGIPAPIVGAEARLDAQARQLASSRGPDEELYSSRLSDGGTRKNLEDVLLAQEKELRNVSENIAQLKAKNQRMELDFRNSTLEAEADVAAREAQVSADMVVARRAVRQAGVATSATRDGAKSPASPRLSPLARPTENHQPPQEAASYQVPVLHQSVSPSPRCISPQRLRTELVSHSPPRLISSYGSAPMPVTRTTLPLAYIATACPAVASASGTRQMYVPSTPLPGHSVLQEAQSAPRAQLVSQQQRRAVEGVALAGISNATAAAVTNPVDVVKVRMQMAGVGSAEAHLGPAAAAQKIMQAEGVTGFYNGLTASLIRELSYSGIRMGLYEPTKELLGATDPAHTPLHLKVAAGALTGTIGSMLANPFDLIKVRMQKPRPAGGAAPYSSIRHALVEIAREGNGITGLWRGSAPTVQRAALLTASQVPSYDHTKHTLLNTGVLREGYVCHFFSSMVAGVVAAAVTSPIDLVKSRVMIQPIDPRTGKGTSYSGVVDCLCKIAKSEGAMSLFKGFHGQWLRIGPHTTVSLMVFEQLRRLVGMNAL